LFATLTTTLERFSVPVLWFFTVKSTRCWKPSGASAPPWAAPEVTSQGLLLAIVAVPVPEPEAVK
jgi:hypothetical protein